MNPTEGVTGKCMLTPMTGSHHVCAVFPSITVGSLPGRIGSIVIV